MRKKGSSNVEIKDIGDVIATRKLEFHPYDGRIEDAIVKIGRPFEHGEGLDWCCPYELCTKNLKKLYGIYGVDPLQALSLALKAVRTEVEYWERSQNGKFYFLGEDGADRRGPQ